MSIVPRQESLKAVAIRRSAQAAFGAYLVWSIYWLVKGRIPPSVFKSVTGLPCPTTGCMRSLFVLGRGDWRQSFCWNPLTSIYLLLLAVSLGCLLNQLLRRERFALPRVVEWSWFTALATGWALKFIIGPRFW